MIIFMVSKCKLLIFRKLKAFYPTALKGCRVLFSPMVSGWAGGWAGRRPVGRMGGRAAGKSLSGLYLKHRKV